MSGSQSRKFIIELEGGVPALGLQRIAATLTTPGKELGKTLLVCLPGGSYSQFYYQAEFQGLDGYNFSRYMAAKGFSILTLDHLGMGKSSQPDAVHLLDKQAIAAFNHAAVQQVLAHIEPKPHLIGIGHSMGGMALIEQQANHMTFDKICVLGWTNIGLSIDTSQIEHQLDQHKYLPTDRSLMRPLFYKPDVPEELIKQDDARASLTPSHLAHQALKPGIVADKAKLITCPVFLAYGEIDISPNPNDEPAFFEQAENVELKIISGSAHNHNFSAAREELWNALDCFSTKVTFKKTA